MVDLFNIMHFNSDTASIVQRSERGTLNSLDAGSNPAGSAILI